MLTLGAVFLITSTRDYWGRRWETSSFSTPWRRDMDAPRRGVLRQKMHLERTSAEHDNVEAAQVPMALRLWPRAEAHLAHEQRHRHPASRASLPAGNLARVSGVPRSHRLRGIRGPRQAWPVCRMQVRTDRLNSRRRPFTRTRHISRPLSPLPQLLQQGLMLGWPHTCRARMCGERRSNRQRSYTQRSNRLQWGPSIFAMPSSNCWSSNCSVNCSGNLRRVCLGVQAAYRVSDQHRLETPLRAARHGQPTAQSRPRARRLHHSWAPTEIGHGEAAAPPGRIART